MSVLSNLKSGNDERVGTANQYDAPQFRHKQATICNENVLQLYEKWQRPTVIVSDGPYGLDSYDGDLHSVDGLADFYEPHVKAWARAAMPSTTLWFWCSELGWATVHLLLIRYGWRFVNCHVWNKGISHVAGNTNTKTLRKFPVVTELCVQYVREPRVGSLPMRDWLRNEWKRTGLPFSRANGACGVKNAATRKYFTLDHLWYFPPPQMFQKLVEYANKHGDPRGRPYFATPNGTPYTGEEWHGMRAKFKCDIGITNVWNEPTVNGNERIKIGNGHNGALHPNQKPLKIIRTIIEASSDAGDVVWEPFGGVCTVAVTCAKSGRRCMSAEINRIFYQRSIKRLVSESSSAVSSK